MWYYVNVKTCSECKLELPEAEFYTYVRKDRTTLYARCKKCHRARLKKVYPKEKKNRDRRNQRKQAYDKINDLKKGPCVDCGVSYPPCVMDYDHVRGTKFKNIAKMIGRNSMAEVLKEIEKCDLVCSNCHRIRTYNRRNAPLV